jgi:peptidoglycan/xylan/chitin deacetylase (PgdA/CDA1 family)
MGFRQQDYEVTQMSHQAYGPLVGVPRILELLGRHGVRSTFFVPGYTAHRYPGVVRAIVDAGHEIAHHGYLHEAMAGLSEQQEAAILDRGSDVLEAVTGQRPVGYRAPMWELNWQSPRLLTERGFLYDSSLMDADHPYELAVSDGRQLVEIPIQWALDDWEQYCYIPDFSGSGLIESPRKAAEIWRLEFEGIRSVGGCFVLTNHPFLTGRPSRRGAGRARRPRDVLRGCVGGLHGPNRRAHPRIGAYPEIGPVARSKRLLVQSKGIRI